MRELTENEIKSVNGGWAGIYYPVLTTPSSLLPAGVEPRNSSDAAVRDLRYSHPASVTY